MGTYTWYENLIKPGFAPPAWVFGPVWTVLYTLIFLTYGVIFYRVYKEEYSKKLVAPLTLNLLFNFLFSPIQFGLQNNLLAAIDITLVLITIIWGMKLLLKESKTLAFLQIPYLLWVGFATILQYSITIINF